MHYVYSHKTTPHIESSQSHWLGVFGTLVLLVALVVMVSNILRVTVKEDIVQVRQATPSKEVRWKYIRREILMVPPMRNVLASLLGLGVQLLFCSTLLSFLAVYHFYQDNHGDLLTYSVLAYCFSGFVNGYTSNSYYQYLLGQRWVMNILSCALLLPALLAMVMLPAYLLELSQSFTMAVPAHMLFYIIGLLCFVSLPSVLLGGIYARRRQKDRLPVNQQLMCSK